MSPEKEGVASHRISLIQKTNSLIKTSARNVGYRAESLSLPRLVIDHAVSPRSNHSNALVTGLRKSSAPAALLPVYRSRAESESSPSISSPSPEDTDPSLRHSPSFPANGLVVRPAFSYYGLWRVRPDPATSTPIPSVSPEKLSKVSEMSSLTVNTSVKRADELKSPNVPEHILNYSAGGYTGGFSGSSTSLSTAGIGQNQSSIHQYIQEVSAKRIFTLTYLRKA